MKNVFIALLLFVSSVSYSQVFREQHIDALNIGNTNRWTGGANDLSSNSQSIIPSVFAVKQYADGLIINAGNKLNAISVIDYGAVAGVNTTAARVLNDTAFDRAARAAASGQMVVIPDGTFYKGATWVLSSILKKFNIWQFGQLNFDIGKGVILEGIRHSYFATADIIGANVNATDSASYSLYQGNGFYIRNGFNCNVVLNAVRGFYAGIKCAGESSTIPKGSQYNTIKFMESRNNYIQVYVTIEGTTDGTQPGDLGNYSNSNWFYGGQVGAPGVTSGVANGAGGTFGVLQKRAAGSNQGGANRFNFNHFVNIGIEGCWIGLWMEKSEWCWFGPGRWEAGQIRKKVFLKEDNSSGDGCFNVDLFDAQGFSESFFESGGRGLSTKMPKTLNSDFAVTGQVIWPNGIGGYIALTGDEPTTRNSVFDMFATGGFSGNLETWKGIHIIRNASSVDDYISFDGKQIVLTATSYTVPANIKTVLANPTTTQTVTLPAAASYPNRFINISNVHATTTISISGGTTTSLAPGLTAVFLSNGTTWIDLNKSASGGGGSSQWTTVGSDIYYNSGRVGATTNAPTARFHIGTASGAANNGAFKINDQTQLVVAVENGLIEPFGGSLYWTSNGTRRKLLDETNVANISNKTFTDLNYTNIYNTDGTLTSARVLTQSLYNLTFTGTGNFSKIGGLFRYAAGTANGSGGVEMNANVIRGTDVSGGILVDGQLSVGSSAQTNFPGPVSGFGTWNIYGSISLLATATISEASITKLEVASANVPGTASASLTDFAATTYVLGTCTANRVLTMNGIVEGKTVIIKNTNNSAFSWSSNVGLLDKDGTMVTIFPNRSITWAQVIGGVWTIIMKY